MPLLGAALLGDSPSQAFTPRVITAAKFHPAGIDRRDWLRPFYSWEHPPHLIRRLLTIPAVYGYYSARVYFMPLDQIVPYQIDNMFRFTSTTDTSAVDEYIRPPVWLIPKVTGEAVQDRFLLIEAGEVQGVRVDNGMLRLLGRLGYSYSRSNQQDYHREEGTPHHLTSDALQPTCNRQQKRLTTIVPNGSA